MRRKKINLDPAKTKAIQVMESPAIFKQLKSFMQKVSYVCKFIPHVAELLKPFHSCLRNTCYVNGARSNSKQVTLRSWVELSPIRQYCLPLVPLISSAITCSNIASTWPHNLILLGICCLDFWCQDYSSMATIIEQIWHYCCNSGVASKQALSDQLAQFPSKGHNLCMKAHGWWKKCVWRHNSLRGF